MEVGMVASCSRRDMLGILAGSVLGAGFSGAQGAAEQSLGALAASNGFLFGASAGPVIDTDAAYRQLYVNQTKIITTDIALKMGRWCRSPGRNDSRARTGCCSSAPATRYRCAAIA